MVKTFFNNTRTVDQYLQPPRNPLPPCSQHEDPDGATMSSDVPDLASNAEDLLKRGQGEGVSPGDQAAASSGSFKFLSRHSTMM